MRKILKFSSILLLLFASPIAEVVPQTNAASATLVNQTKNVIQGTVVNVRQTPGFGKPDITWWTIEVQTATGTIEVRVAPTWWYPALNIKKGDKVRVTGFVPFFWGVKSINGLMACRVEDETTGTVYDFSSRRKWCGKSANLRRGSIFNKNIVFKSKNGDVVFSHYYHVVEKKQLCYYCHPGIFKIGAGMNKFTMQDIWNGRYCGVCHDGNKAFSAKANCLRCHKRNAIRTKQQSSGSLPGNVPTASLNRLENVISGTVVNVKQVPGLGKKKITWWAIDVQTATGMVEVRIVSTWWYPEININKGDKVKVTGFIPPYWKIKGIKGLMACKIEDETTGAVYDFSNFRKWCRRIK
jgi:c(7)-type cytochrome triheme protein